MIDRSIYLPCTCTVQSPLCGSGETTSRIAADIDIPICAVPGINQPAFVSLVARTHVRRPPPHTHASATLPFHPTTSDLGYRTTIFGSWGSWFVVQTGVDSSSSSRRHVSCAINEFAVHFAVQYPQVLHKLSTYLALLMPIHPYKPRCHKPPELGIASGRYSRYPRSSIAQSYFTSCISNQPAS